MTANKSGLRTSAIPASKLNLVVTAIVLWSAVYLERAVQALIDGDKTLDDAEPCLVTETSTGDHRSERKRAIAGALQRVSA